MLQLLLDEHISPDVATGLVRRVRRISVLPLPNWEDGRFLGLPDDILLKAAALARLTLVTYDRKTIPPLLKTWAEDGRDHAGVIFVDHRTIPSSNIGGLIRALHAVHLETADWDWTNRILSLRR